MKQLVVAVFALAVVAAPAFAQDKPSEPAPDQGSYKEAPKEEKRSPYYKKVQGWLWLEGLVGPSAYDPDQFRTLSIGSSVGGAPRLRGTQWGFSAGTGFGKGFFLGWYYRQANYSQHA